MFCVRIDDMNAIIQNIRLTHVTNQINNGCLPK